MRPLGKTVVQFLIKLNIQLPYDPQLHSLAFIPVKGKLTFTQKSVHTPKAQVTKEKKGDIKILKFCVINTAIKKVNSSSGRKYWLIMSLIRDLYSEHRKNTSKSTTKR